MEKEKEIKDLGKLPDGISYELYQKMWKQSLQNWAMKTSERLITFLNKNGKKK